MTSAPRQRSGLRTLSGPARRRRGPPSAPTTTSCLPKSREALRQYDTVDGRDGRRDGRRRHRRRRRLWGSFALEVDLNDNLREARRRPKTASRGNARMSSSSRARAPRNARTARPGGQRGAAATVRSPTTQTSSPRGTGGGASSSTASWICVLTKAGATRSMVLTETVATYRGASSPASVMTRTLGAPVTYASAA